MLITDSAQLEQFYEKNRVWQGIPGIEVTKKGRIFSAFYSGGIDEGLGNFVILLKSDDGVNFSEPVAALYAGEEHRCYDQCLWIDPLERLWFICAFAPDNAVYAVICDNPDADNLEWSDEFRIGNDVMLNKPTVLSTGEWLFPIAVWDKGITAGGTGSEDPDKGSYVYRSVDNGRSFVKLGHADVRNHTFDEHMVLELSDGRLAMFIRAIYGIAVSYSYDRGKTWTKGEDSGLGGPCSRFFIRRLKSGRILLINHYNFTGRSHLTAMLSEDECRTWKYKLLLDERSDVSYPDAKESEDGYIYITYDRERGAGADFNSLNKVYKCAREILIARITEEDIIAGSIVNKGSKLKQIISKLGKYAKENENPYKEIKRYSDEELAEMLADKEDKEILNTLFDTYSVNCSNMHKIDGEKLDSMIDKLKAGENKKKIILNMIMLIRSASDEAGNKAPVVDKIKDVIKKNIAVDLSAEEISERVNISKYYMCHLFKKITGITIIDFKNELKIAMAKKLLVSSDKKIADIALECGFCSSSYFSKTFKESETVSPVEYRNLLRINVSEN